ncbi:AaceriADL164Cp [[Ashbya] aceris (nom. inval.)]|nr:AaceriADL164Cp [[Ashbya] aceris (nom. inval.)]
MPHTTSDSSSQRVRVAVLGAAGGIGQPLSLLLKTQLAQVLGDANASLELALYDVAADALAGVAADLSHVNTPVEVSHHVPSSREDEGALREALTGASVVVIPAGVPRKPGMTRDDLININAGIIKTLAKGIAGACDLEKVFVLVISNPVNSLVPVMVRQLIRHAEAKKVPHAGVERRVFGVTQLDMVRASAFVRSLGELGNEVPAVPVIGGHSGETILPLFAPVQQRLQFSLEQRKKLTHRVQYGGDEIVAAKKGAGSATLSMAYAAYVVAERFANLALGNVSEIQETLYVSLYDRENKPIAEGAAELLSHIGDISYFAVPVKISADAGVTSIEHEVWQQLDDYDKENLLPPCLEGLRKNIETGETLGNN